MVEDNCSCEPAVVNNIVENNASCGNNNGSARIVLQSNPANYNYSWTPNEGTPNAVGNERDGLTAGIYSIIVSHKDNENCFVEVNITIENNDGPSVEAPNTTPATCEAADGSATFAQTDLIYTWTHDGVEATTRTDLAEGTYEVQAVHPDLADCPNVILVEISAENNLIANFTVQADAMCDEANGRVSIEVLSGTGSGDYSYNWSDGVETANASRTDLAIGIYAVTLTDNTTGCIYTFDNISIDDGGCDVVCTNPEVLDIVVENATCGENNGIVTLELIGNETTDYTYNWSQAVSTSHIASDLVAGSYMVTIYDAEDDNCYTVIDVIIENIDGPQASISTSSSATCNAADGSISLSPSNYSYQWSDGGTGAERNDLTAATYSVTFTDNTTACVNVMEITISEDNPLSTEVNIDQMPSCGEANGAATINVSGGSGNYNYSWGATNSRTDLAGGDYDVSIIDNDTGCEDVISFVMIDDVAMASINVSDVQLDCPESADGTVFFNVQYESNFVHPARVVIEDMDGNPAENESLSIGEYCIFVYDANDCLGGQACFAVEAPNAIEAEVILTHQNCEVDGSISLMVTGGTDTYRFDWADLAGTDDPQNRVGLESDIYRVTITDGSNCSAILNAIVINDECNELCEEPAISNLIVVNSNCDAHTGSIFFEMADEELPCTYQWPDNISDTNGATDLAAGVYEVTITNANDPTCFIVESIIVGNQDGPQASIESITAANCLEADGQVQLMPLTYSYSWEDGGSGPNRNDLFAGIHYVTVTEGATACTNVIEIEIPAESNLQATALIQREPTCGAADGMVNINVSGGTSNYEFSWGGNGSREDLAAGIYDVTITDMNSGCETNIIFALSDDVAGAEVESRDVMVSCHGEEDAQADFDVNYSDDFVEPASIRITSANGEEQIDGKLVPGSYCLYVIDGNGCIAGEDCFEVAEPDAIEVSLMINNANCDTEGTVNLNVTGGMGNYNFDWSDMDESDEPANRNDLEEGVYTLVIVDEMACALSTEIRITNECGGCATTPIVQNTVVIDAACGMSNGAAVIEMSGNNSDYTFNWPLQVNNPSAPTDLEAGAYEVTITMASDNSCFTTTNILVGSIDGPTASIESLTPATCMQANGTIELSPLSYKFEWSDGASGAIRTDLAAGEYMVTVLDETTACTDIMEIMVDETSSMEAEVRINNQPTCGETNGSVSILVTGTTDELTYSWGASETQDNLAGGMYDVTVTDESGCEMEVMFTLTDAEATADIEILSTAISCAGSNDGFVDFNVNLEDGFASPATTTIEDIDGNIYENGNLASGNYCIIVMDANACLAAERCFELIEPQAIEVELTITNESCDAAASIDLTVTPSTGAIYSFDWSDLEGDNNPEDRSGLEAGFYSLTITNEADCSVTVETINVTNECLNCMQPVVAEAVVQEATCENNDGELSLTMEGNAADFTYSWTPDLGTPNANNNLRTNLPAGIYTISIAPNEDANCTTQITVEIDDDCGNNGGGACDATAGSLTTLDDSVCLENGTAQVAAILSEAPNVPEGFQSIFVLTSGTTDNATIEQFNADPIFIVDAEGGYTVHTLVYDPTTLNLNDIQLGTTTAAQVAAMFGEGEDDLCGALDLTGQAFTVEDCDENEEECLPASITNIAVIDASCGNADGTATLNVNGDANAYTFTWSTNLGSPTNETGNARTSLPSGTYSVTIANVDDPNCTVVENFVVGNIEGPTAMLPTTTNANCGAADGSADFGMTIPEITFTWEDGVMTNNRDDLASGAYFVTITNQNNPECPNVVTFEIGIDNSLVAAATVTSNATCGEADGSVSIAVEGGSGNYTWTLLTTPEVVVTDGIFDNLMAGTYTVEIIDNDSNCETTTTFTISDDLAVASIILESDVVELACAGIYNATVIFETEFTDEFVFPQTIEIRDGQGNVYENGSLTPGAYCIVILDNNACLAAESCFEVVEPEPLVVEASITHAECETGGAIDLTVSGGTGDYTYVWLDLTGEEQPQDRTNLQPGNYTVSVTDANNCVTVVSGLTVAFDCECTADAGTTSANSGIVCLVDGIASITAFNENQVVPTAYAVAYLLTDGGSSIITQISETPAIQVTATGSYDIYTIVYNPNQVNLNGVIELGQTTIFDLNSLLIQGGGTFCAGFDLVGASVTVEECADCNVDAGEIVTNDATTLCVDDFADDIVNIIIGGNEGASTTFIVTDENGTILAISDQALFNFEGAGAGTCFIYAIAHNASITALAMGQNISALGGCFDVSNAIEITRLIGEDCGDIGGCNVVSGSISTLDPSTYCVDDGLADLINISVEGSIGNYTYAITNADGIILGISSEPMFDVEGAGAGTCLIFGIAFAGEVTGLELDGNISDLDGCFDLSNSIEITRLTDAGCGALATAETIYNVLPINTRDTTCINLEAGFDIATTTIVLENNTTTSNFGDWALTDEGCLIYNAGNVAGINVDTIVILATNEGGFTDTTTIIVSITAEEPTEQVVAFTLVAGDEAEACGIIPGNFGNNINITLESGGLTASNTFGTFAVDATTACLTYTANNLTGVAVDTICVLICDLDQNLCHTICYVPTIMPSKDEQIVTTTMETAVEVCLDTTQLFGDLVSVDNCGEPTNGVVNIDAGTNCITYTPNESFEGEDEFCILLCDTEGICDTTVVIVQVEQDGGNGGESCNLFEEGTLSLLAEDCEGPATYCVDINLADIDDYSLTDNGNPYSGMFTGCNSDTTLSYTYTDLLMVAPNGPYELTSWIVNTATFDGDFNTLADLVDSMNVWDPMGNWELDEALLSISGGNMNNTYGNLVIFHSMMNATVNLTAQQIVLPMSTMIEVDTGFHQIIFTHIETACTDTLLLNVDCQPSQNAVDTIEVAILVGFSDTICIPTNDIPGDIVSVTNDCEELSGTAVDFNILEDTTCIEITADLIGSDTACIVVCNATEECDTTIVVVNVLPPRVDTVTFSIELTDNSTYCIDTTELSGTITSINNICPDNAADVVEFVIDEENNCVDYTGIAIGTGQACIVICDDIGYCDTTFMIVDVEMGTVTDSLPPIAENDEASVQMNGQVDIEILLNDTINGTFNGVNILDEPSFGSIMNGGSGVFTYIPDADICEEVDSFTYILANTFATDTATVYVTILCEDLTIFSGFSPNDDGVNDTFIILGLESLPGNRLMVFNRWGNQVYDSVSEYDNQWDGSWEGKDLPDGTYFYIFDMGDGEKVSGYLQINR